MNRFTIHIFFLIGYLSSSAQVTIKGLVVDAESNLPITNTEIFESFTGAIYYTDSKGNYKIGDLEKTNVELLFFSLNYESQKINLTLSRDTVININLSRLSQELTTVELNAKRQEVFALRKLKDHEGMSIYAGKKTEVVLLDLINGNLASNNSRQVFAQVSGLNIYESNEGGLQLSIGGRGLDPNRTSNFNTRQNGYDISADVLGYPENYYTPPAEAIDEIKVLRGASSLQYGTQFGGLIDFKLRSLLSYQKIDIISKQSIGSNNFIGSFNWLGLRKGNFSFSGYYHHKRGDGFRENSQFESNNIFISGRYDIDTKTYIKSDFTYQKYLAKQAGGLTDQQFNQDPFLSTRDRNWFEVNWKLYNIYLEHKLNAEDKLSMSFFALDASRNSVGFRGNPIELNENPILSLDERDSNGNHILPRDLILGTFKNYGFESRYINKYILTGKKAIGLLGIKLYDSNNTSIQGPGTLGDDAFFELAENRFPDYPSQSNFRFPNFNVALFGENVIYLNPRLSITPGFRFEHILTRAEGEFNNIIFDNAGNPLSNNMIEETEDFKRSFFLFGLGFDYKINENTVLNLNVSQNYRSVTFSDIRIVSPSFVVDPGIKDESGYTFDISIRGRKNKFLSYDVGLFSILYNDRIGIILDNRANRLRTNIGDAIIGGIESLVDFNFERLIWGDESPWKLNLFLNMSLTSSTYLQSEANNVEGNRVEFIPRTNIKTGLNLGYKNFLLSFQGTMLSDQFTDAQNSLASIGNDRIAGIVGEIPGYRVFDLTAQYQFKNFKIEGGLNNLFNEIYFTQRATGYPGPGIIPSSNRTFFTTLSFRLNS